MIHSMTGFAQERLKCDGKEISVILKSVNHRFLDCMVHLPQGMDHWEGILRKKIQGALKRGRVNVHLYIDGPTGGNAVLDEHLAHQYIRLAGKLKKSARLKNDLGVDGILRLPGVVTLSKNSAESKKVDACVGRAFEGALKKLLLSRRVEGAAISADLKKFLKDIGQRAQALARRSGSLAQGKKKTLTSDELGVYLKNTNVAEELSRIGYHVKSFLKNLSAGGSCGKVFDFLCQELLREANTVGSKAQDSLMAHDVVLMKDKIEKLREQIQNVE